MPPAPNEPSSHEPDAGDPNRNDPDRDTGDAAPDANGAPLSDPVRTARLALQAMLGPGTPPPGDEDPAPDDTAENDPR